MVSWLSKLVVFAKNTQVLEKLNLFLPVSTKSAEIKFFMLAASFLFAIGKVNE